MNKDFKRDIQTETKTFLINGKKKDINLFHYKTIHTSDEINSLLNQTKNIFLSSDYHINKPSRIKDGIKNIILSKHNKVVGKDDVFIFLGDLLNHEFDIKLEEVNDFISNLNGRKIMVLGNNDEYQTQTYLDMGFEFVVTNFKYNDMIFTHSPIDTDCINFHGHIHASRNYFNIEYRNHIDVYVDDHMFTPLNIKKIDKDKYKSISTYDIDYKHIK